MCKLFNILKFNDSESIRSILIDKRIIRFSILNAIINIQRGLKKKVNFNK